MMSTSPNESPKDINIKNSQNSSSNKGKHYGYHSPHSKTLPAIDLTFQSWNLPTAKPLSLSYNNSYNNSLSTTTTTTTVTTPPNDINLNLNLSLECQYDTDYSQQSYNQSLQSYYQHSPLDRASPSSLLLHQSITSLPNLPTLNLNDSKTSEENILCTVTPKDKSKPKLLLREAAKSEPPMPCSYNDNKKYLQLIRNHQKSSKSLHINTIQNLKHITSQPPPMPLYIHNKHNINNINVKLKQQKQKQKHIQANNNNNNNNNSNNNNNNHVHFHKSINNIKPSQSVPPNKYNNINNKNINKNKKKKKKVLKRSETLQPTTNNNNNNNNNISEVRVMRDSEVLQMDEEIPIDKFIDALQKGYARIMTENEQNEEYKKSARIARSVSVGNMQAYKDEILLEQQQKRTRIRTRVRGRKFKKKKKKNNNKFGKSKSNKNTPKTQKKYNINIKPKSKPISNRFQFNKNQNASSDSDTSSDSDSNSLHLLDPPKDIQTANDIIIKPSKRKMKIKRSTTADNNNGNNNINNNKNKNKIRGLRIRSKTMQSQNKNNNQIKRNRHRPNAHYRHQPSQNCPTSPIIPEEDDILDMLSVNEVIDDTISTHSGNSSCGFSSDSDSDNSSSNTDHECEIPLDIKSPILVSNAKSCDTITSGLSFETSKFKIIKQNNNSDSDHENSINKLLFPDASTNQLPIVDELRQRSLSSNHNINNIQVPITRERTLSNESMCSNNSSNSSSSSSSSSVSSSSDWDEEVREEEEAQRLHDISDSDSDDTVTDHSELATSSDSDEYKHNMSTNQNEDKKLFSLQQSNSSTVKLKHIYESQSDCEDENDININNNNNITNDNYFNSRPQSTPFRSSKGTAVFLSHFKTYRNDELRDNISGNLNELINGTSKTHSNKNKNKNISQQNHKQFMQPIKTITPVTINNKNKINNKFINNPNEYNSPIPIKMKKKKKKTRKTEK